MKRYDIFILSIALIISGCISSENRQRPQKELQQDNIREVVSTSTPSIEIAETEINLGVIPEQQQDITGEIFFFNVGGKPLQIRNIKGPCSCFSGFSGDRLLQPGHGGVLEVKFNKNKIAAGKVKELVNIETNDPGNNLVTVFFNFEVTRDPDKEEMRILKSELLSVRRELEDLRKGMSRVIAELDGSRTKTKKANDTITCDVTIGSSPFLGNKNAPVTIIEFGDFQCPFCIREYPTIKRVLQEYPDQVKFVFKHFPLGMHKKAKAAHAAAELAHIHGGSEMFWKMHDLIMAEPKKLGISDLRGYAESLGMDLAEFDEAMADENRVSELLKTDIAEAQKCQVRGTPSILINGLKLTSRNFNGYKNRIDEILQGKKEKPAILPPPPPPVPKPPALPKMLEPGQLAPNFTLHDIKGNPVTLSSLQAKEVLLFFGDVKFLLSADMVSLLNELDKGSNQNKGEFKVIFIALGNTVEEVTKFVKENDINFDVLPDTNRFTRNLYGLNRIPAIFVVGADGKIIYNELKQGHEVLNSIIAKRLEKPDNPANGRFKQIKRQDIVPSFELNSINGDIVSLNDFRGQKVLLVFCSIRSAYCDEKVPLLNKIENEQYKVIFVAMGSKGDDVRKYGEARKVRFDILLDPDRSVGRKFGVREVPTVFVVDADGAITYSGTEEGHTIWQMLKDQKMDTVSTSK